MPDTDPASDTGRTADARRAPDARGTQDAPPHESAAPGAPPRPPGEATVRPGAEVDPPGGEAGPPGRQAEPPREEAQPPGEGAGSPRDGAGPSGEVLPPPPRPRFRPVTIRTARDAVTTAALYLRWLGYRDVRRADQRPPAGIGLAARGIVAQVDPTVRPATPRDVECLWLTAMTESAGCVYFSLAGYADDARDCADRLGVPLFVLDLTGTPRPVNGSADDLAASGG
ncbi:hypothetical protein [Streptomyces sp. NPDC059786]|uniref:hypothetical protein n=1 Tax=Streptomyces sp. NPDC059786 TaxID=3346946 RepID=UPI003665621C